MSELEKLPETSMGMKDSFQKGQLFFLLGKNNEAVAELLQVETLPFKSEVQNAVGKSRKTKRLRNGRLLSQALLLAGQILWLDHKFLEAVMQSFLLERQAPIEQPGLYAPPLNVSN